MATAETEGFLPRWTLKREGVIAWAGVTRDFRVGKQTGFAKPSKHPCESAIQ